MRRMLKSRKAVSPVIATIIIVAIAISIAIAVAYWMVGITGAFTRFEKLEIVSAYAETIVGNGFNISMRIKNSGTVDSTIDIVFVNGKPYDVVSDTVDTTLIGASLKTGHQDDYYLVLSDTQDGNYVYKSGQSVEITIHTAGGKEYPKNVVLP